MPPSDVTVSAITSAPCACAMVAIASALLPTPVDVSACTNETMRMSGLRVERPLYPVERDGRAPVVVDDDRHAAGALDVLELPPAEGAVAADEHLVARLDEVDEAGLHADGTGAGDGERDPVLGLEGVAQQILELVHHAHELGVEVADRRSRHGVEHALVDVRGAGAHEHATRRVERCDSLHCCHDHGSFLTSVCRPLDYTSTRPGVYQRSSVRLGYRSLGGVSRPVGPAPPARPAGSRPPGRDSASPCRGSTG